MTLMENSGNNSSICVCITINKTDRDENVSFMEKKKNMKCDIQAVPKRHTCKLMFPTLGFSFTAEILLWRCVFQSCRSRLQRIRSIYISARYHRTQST